MGARGCLTKTFLVLIAVATVMGCEDNTSLTKICPQPIPCTVDSNGTIITSNHSELYQKYQTGECQLGELRCDKDGDEYCHAPVGPVAETCDLKDNDCDGVVDEGFDLDGDGFSSCNGDCNDQNININPGRRELCDNVDNNCNDQIDENVYKHCSSLPPGTPLGECRAGTSSCTMGRWNSCQGEVLPVPEICDGKDNDCNGLIDERQYNVCGATNVGVCELGDRVCTGNEQVCVEAIYPSGEVCDAADNDCDGLVDEGIYQPCSSACGTGIETCAAGLWVNCTAEEPVAELCDGIDNDCDGDVDEGCECVDGQIATCRNNIIDRTTGAIVNCGLGITMCDINGMWGPCYFFGAGPEMCNNWDDDCDGQVDGQTTTCGNPNTAGIGVCRLGDKTCTAGHWGACQGEVVPQAEICDHLDNDCDGDVDEGLNPHAKVDMIFAIDISGSMCGNINALVQGIGAYITDFAGTDHRFGIVTFPGTLTPRNPGIVRTLPPLLPAAHFQNVLSQITCNGGGWEPSYDVAHMLSNPSDPFNIGWRSDAYPYIIIIGDENAQTWSGLTQADIAPQMSSCGIGGCVPGDAIEIYVIGSSFAMSQWDQITYHDPMRFINISPADPQRYTQFFRNIFQNICI